MARQKGFKHSDETRARCSASAPREHTPQWNSHARLSHTGKPYKKPHGDWINVGKKELPYGLVEDLKRLAACPLAQWEIALLLRTRHGIGIGATPTNVCKWLAWYNLRQYQPPKDRSNWRTPKMF